MKTFKNDSFSGSTEFAMQLLESTEADTKKGILCRIKGDFFFPDGFSRNKRFYPKELWEKALSSPRIQKKLKDRNLYGTISHEQEINDKAFLEGKISHIVEKLEITNEGRGYGEIAVLNTPAGEILDTLARAGSKLYVSTRGHGTFKGEKDGMPMVDPDTFVLETVDFVLEAGFEGASPELSEKLKQLSIENDDSKIGEKTMEKLMEKLQKQNEDYVAELKEIREKLEVTQGDLEAIKKENDTLAKTNEALNEKKAELDKFLTLGSFKEVKSLVEKMEKIVPEWKSFKKLEDSADEISEALTLAENLIGQYEELGKPHEIKEAFDMLEGFKAKVDEIGTLSEINKALDLLEAHAKEAETRKKNEAIAKLSKRLGVDEKKISKVYGKLSEKEIEEMFEGLSESDELDEFRVPRTRIDENTDEDEDEDDVPSFKKPLALRLVEKYSGVIK